MSFRSRAAGMIGNILEHYDDKFYSNLFYSNSQMVKLIYNDTQTYVSLNSTFMIELLIYVQLFSF